MIFATEVNQSKLTLAGQ